MPKSSTTSDTQLNTAFWFHVFITVLAWVGIFLFSWYLMVAAYLVVQIQFIVFDRCLMNEAHDLDDDNNTMYSIIFEHFGWYPNRSTVKFIVRKMLYIILGFLAFFWQVVLKFEPLLF